MGGTVTPPPAFRCHATASTSRPSLYTSGPAWWVMRYWDGSCASGDSDCNHVQARDHGRGEEPIAPHRGQPPPQTRIVSEAGGRAPRCRWAGLRGSGIVCLVPKRLLSSFQCQAQNKAKLVSETRRRFEVEYLTGGYHVLALQRASPTLLECLLLSLWEALGTMLTLTGAVPCMFPRFSFP